MTSLRELKKKKASVFLLSDGLKVIELCRTSHPDSVAIKDRRGGQWSGLLTGLSDWSGRIAYDSLHI